MASSSIERGIVRALPVLAVVWAVVIVAAPWLATRRFPVPGGAHVAAAVYWLGAMVCHQQPARSFHAAGAQLPVCARCTGLYLSAAAGVIVGWALRRPARSFAAWRGPLLLASLPTLATLAIEWWSPATTSGMIRAAAAVPLGAVVGALVCESMSFRGRLL